MSMIICPACGAEISDKAEKCIKCGFRLIEEPRVFCLECGSEILKEDDICSNCGCPVDIKNEDFEKPQKVEVTKIKTHISKKIVFIIIAALLIIIGAFITINSIQTKISEDKAATKLEEYSTNINYTSSLMLSGSAEAESCCKLIHDVWYNTIYEKSDYQTNKYTKENNVFFNSDFNTSLKNLYSDESFNEKIEFIKKNQNEVASEMKNLTNPPDEYREAYNSLQSFYDAYLYLTNCAVNPSGSLTTYTSNFNQADSDTVNAYEKLKVYLK